MTLLVAWAGADCKKRGSRTSSLYFATDSRISWNKNNGYDGQQKVFGSSISPDIFAFCGDVTFCGNHINTLVNCINHELILLNGNDIDIKVNNVQKYFNDAFQNYPKNILSGKSTILYGTRINMDFFLYKAEFDKMSSQIIFQRIPIPNKSILLHEDGSGKNEFHENWIKENSEKRNASGTSRSVYHCLHKTIINTKEPTVGGAPQIIGLYRKFNAIPFGIIIDNKRFVYGSIFRHDNAERIEWRNENFERVDGTTGLLIERAQRQPFE